MPPLVQRPQENIRKEDQHQGVNEKQYGQKRFHVFKKEAPVETGAETKTNCL